MNGVVAQDRPDPVDIIVFETPDGQFREKAYAGTPADRVVLPRLPRNDRERAWVEVLRGRLVPNGEVVVSDGPQ